MRCRDRNVSWNHGARAPRQLVFLYTIALLFIAQPSLMHAQSKRQCFGIQYKVGLSHQKWFVAKDYDEDRYGSIDRAISRRNANRLPSFSHEPARAEQFPNKVVSAVTPFRAVYYEGTVLSACIGAGIPTRSPLV
jgi:hypothetical protein